MFRRKMLGLSVACAATAALFAACNTSGFGIFYSIQQERRLVGNESLPNTISPHSLVKAADAYYLAAGELYARAVDDDEWVAMVRPEATRLAGPAVVFPGDPSYLYAVWHTVAGDASALYRLLLPILPGGEWEPVTAFSSDEYVDSLVAVDGRVIAGIRIGGDVPVHRSFETADGSAFQELDLVGQLASVTDAAFHDGSRWIAAGARLYRSTSDFVYEPVDVPRSMSTAVIGGLFASAETGTLIVSSRNGTLYVLDDETWIERAATDSKGNALVLHDVDEVRVGAAVALLVGTSKGYLELVYNGGFADTFTSPGTTGSLTTDENYQKIPLRDVAVRFFLVDVASGAGTIFAATAGSGLWLNRFDPAAGTKMWNPE